MAQRGATPRSRGLTGEGSFEIGFERSSKPSRRGWRRPELEAPGGRGPGRGGGPRFHRSSGLPGGRLRLRRAPGLVPAGLLRPLRRRAIDRLRVEPSLAFRGAAATQLSAGRTPATADDDSHPRRGAAARGEGKRRRVSHRRPHRCLRSLGWSSEHVSCGRGRGAFVLGTTWFPGGRCGRFLVQPSDLRQERPLHGPEASALTAGEGFVASGDARG